MARREEGWPLGLRPLNARIGLIRSSDLSGSISFSTLATGSPSSTTGSSSDLDTQSTGSFFHDKSITLGSLIGISSILELSRRSSTRRRTVLEASRDNQKNLKSSYSRPWIFSLCPKLSTDAVTRHGNARPLGQFLLQERRGDGTTH